MMELYQKILERFSDEDREWIKEIFCWIIGPKRQLTINELENAVHFCRDDELEDFRDFVLRTCGSLFIVTRRGDEWSAGSEFVQTVHKTLRAFIMNPACPPDLHVTVEQAHAHITRKGLTFLSTPEIEMQPLHHYLVAQWHYHLVNTTVGHKDDKILCGLYSLFHSRHLKKWVHDDVLSHWKSEETETETPIEKNALRDVQIWLSRYEEGNQAHSHDDAPLFVAALQWRNACVQNLDKLGESVAKAAALLWLFDELELKKTIIAAFKLGIGSYWRRQNLGLLSDREELRELFETDFGGLIDWAGGSEGETLNERNLSIARITLIQWDESHSLRLEMARKDDNALWGDIHRFHSLPLRHLLYQIRKFYRLVPIQK